MSSESGTTTVVPSHESSLTEACTVCNVVQCVMLYQKNI